MKVQTVLMQLRERPEEERLAISLGAALIVGVVLLGLWVLVFVTSGGRGEAQGAAVDQQAAAVESLEGLRNEFDERSYEFQTQYEQLRRALEEAGSLTEEVVQVQPVVELSVGEDGEVLVEEVFVGATEDVIE